MKKLFLSLVFLLISVCLFATTPELDSDRLISFSTDSNVQGSTITFMIDANNSVLKIKSSSFSGQTITLFIQSGDGNVWSYDFSKNGSYYQVAGSTYNDFLNILKKKTNLALIARAGMNNVYKGQLYALDVSLLNSLMEKAKNAEYMIGDIGPAGGYIFYDKGYESYGWRYLEVTPADVRMVNGKPSCDATDMWYDLGEKYYIFGYYRTTSNGNNLFVNGTTTYFSYNCTNESIGSGKQNTELLVKAMGSRAYKEYSGAGITDEYAAKLCDDLISNGYDDWFLPSKDELDLIYKNLKRKGIGSFASGYYWSSSEKYNNTGNAWYDDSGYQSNDYRSSNLRVRAIRAF